MRRGKAPGTAENFFCFPSVHVLYSYLIGGAHETVDHASGHVLSRPADSPNPVRTDLHPSAASGPLWNSIDLVVHPGVHHVLDRAFHGEVPREHFQLPDRNAE